MSSNHQNPNCNFAEPLISYLYGEINGAEKVEFETHLESCAACYNELAEFGLARSAVQEWRSIEFEKLATPLFEIPANKTESLTAARPQSWFAGLSALLSFKPALAMSALAVIIGLFGFAVFVSNFKGASEMAKKSGEQNVMLPNVSPTIEKTVEQPKIIADKNEGEIVAPTKVVDKNQEKPKTTAMKTALTVPKKYPTGAATVRAVENRNKEKPKPNAAPRVKVLRLSDEEETEDNSVRLADLFDEIETR